MDINDFDLRTLQKESARALTAMEATNNNIFKFNQQAHHDSQNWYKAVIKWYIDEYGGLPSQVGPGTKVNLIQDM